MRRLITPTALLVLAIFLMAFAPNQPSSPPDVPVIKFPELQAMIAANDEPVLVVNFWATWCVPCIKEMPHFAELENKYAERGVKILFVSMDEPDQVASRVVPFLERKGYTQDVVLLDEVDGEVFIEPIHSSWTGAIPATALYGPGGKQLAFHEGDFSFEELEAFVTPHITQ